MVDFDDAPQCAKCSWFWITLAVSPSRKNYFGITQKNTGVSFLGELVDMFGLQALNPEKAQETFSVEADSSEDSFCLSRPDLCLDNIIVDDELHIRGVIDWEEFSATVPRDGCLPCISCF